MKETTQDGLVIIGPVDAIEMPEYHTDEYWKIIELEKRMEHLEEKIDRLLELLEKK